MTAAATPALHHKLLANAAGREGDLHADARDDAQAAGHHALAAEHAAKAAAAYEREAYHLAQRELAGGALGGPQPSASMARAYQQAA